jgi:hypothetical protein
MLSFAQFHIGCWQAFKIFPVPAGNRTPKRKFKTCPIGYIQIDIAEVKTQEGKLHLFVAIDRTSKIAYVELHQKATRAISKHFLGNLVSTVPDAIHTVLADNGIKRY